MTKLNRAVLALASFVSLSNSISSTSAAVSGEWVGAAVGDDEGARVGALDGLCVGEELGLDDGACRVGRAEGA